MVSFRTFPNLLSVSALYRNRGKSKNNAQVVHQSVRNSDKSASSSFSGWIPLVQWCRILIPMPRICRCTIVIPLCLQIIPPSGKLESRREEIRARLKIKKSLAPAVPALQLSITTRRREMEGAGLPFRTSVAYHSRLNGFSLPKNYSICSSCVHLVYIFFIRWTFFDGILNARCAAPSAANVESSIKICTRCQMISTW